VLFSLFSRKSFKISSLTRFCFRYNEGNMANSQTIYTLTYKDGVPCAEVKKKGAETSDSFKVDEAFVKRLEKILLSHSVDKWNGFIKSDKRVHDGNSFDMSMTNESGEHFSALGYMKWPKNYKEVRAELDSLFQEC